jgi:hypothetical protein
MAALRATFNLRTRLWPLASPSRRPAISLWRRNASFYNQSLVGLKDDEIEVGRSLGVRAAGGLLIHKCSFDKQLRHLLRRK